MLRKVCVCNYMYTCIYIYIYICICICICICAYMHIYIYNLYHVRVCMCVCVYVCVRMCMHAIGTSTSQSVVHGYFQPFPACTQRSCPPRPHICPAAGMKAGRVRRKKRRKGEDGGTEEEPPKARGATCCDGICTEKHHWGTTARSIMIYQICQLSWIFIIFGFSCWKNGSDFAWGSRVQGFEDVL